MHHCYIEILVTRPRGARGRVGGHYSHMTRSRGVICAIGMPPALLLRNSLFDPFLPKRTGDADASVTLPRRVRFFIFFIIFLM